MTLQSCQFFNRPFLNYANSVFQTLTKQKVSKPPSSQGYCQKGLLQLYISMLNTSRQHLSHIIIIIIWDFIVINGFYCNKLQYIPYSNFHKNISQPNFGWLYLAGLLFQLILTCLLSKHQIVLEHQQISYTAMESKWSFWRLIMTRHNIFFNFCETYNFAQVIL